MLYNYDNAIARDLEKSFNDDIVVKVIDSETAIDLVAQIKEDEIRFPVVTLTRDENVGIDKSRMNFTRAHKGVAAVLDPDTNELYYERAIPVDLKYELSVLTTNTADMDEIIRELIFKYTSMYFITFTLPYECKRKVRFGVRIDPDSDISRKSGSSEYIKSGTLYESTIQLSCDGCVLVSYTAAKLQRGALYVENIIPTSIEP